MSGTPGGEGREVAAEDAERTTPFAAVRAGSAVRRSLSERLGSAGGGGAPTETFPRESGRSAPSPDGAQTAVPGPRRVRLTLSRVDPWSAMKLSFLTSVAVAVGIVVAAAIVWFVLDSMYVFADIEDLFVSIGSEGLVQLMSYLEFDRVISLATIIAVVDVLLITALGTIGAFVYNLVAALVGGLHVTLTDD